MPRTGKGGGGPKQPIRAANDQAYGERQDQVQAQKAIPLPDMRIEPGSVPRAVGPAPQQSLDDAMMAAQAESARAMPTALGAPSARPTESVLTPDNKPRNTSQAQVQALREVQLITGSQAFENMIERMLMTQRANGPRPGPSRFSPPMRTESPNESGRIPRR